MQADTVNIIPVNSDVNEFLQDEMIGFDSYVSAAFKELAIKKNLARAGITKRSGVSTDLLFFNLVQVPFLMISTLFLFVQEQILDSVASKSTYYRFLENANYNWSKFLSLLSHSASKLMTENDAKVKYFVLDDTVREVTGKLVEGASYIFDHVKGKSVLGFQKLVLGVFDGEHFIPVAQRICGGKKTPKSQSKATKYNKIKKSEKIATNSPGFNERQALTESKLVNAYGMLKKSCKQYNKVKIVLFDSWFCFNSFITKIKKSLDLDVICQLKNLPKTNRYIFHEKEYSLKQLYAYQVKPKMRKVKKKNYKQHTVTVLMSKSKIPLKIVFIENDSSDKFHAFASTKTTLTFQEILEHYSQRWSIEVFFKNCKQYLNYGKEQVSNFDSLVASDSLVFTRYIILTYL